MIRPPAPNTTLPVVRPTGTWLMAAPPGVQSTSSAANSTGRGGGGDGGGGGGGPSTGVICVVVAAVLLLLVAAGWAAHRRFCRPPTSGQGFNEHYLPHEGSPHGGAPRAGAAIVDNPAYGGPAVEPVKRLACAQLGSDGGPVGVGGGDGGDGHAYDRLRRGFGPDEGGGGALVKRGNPLYAAAGGVEPGGQLGPPTASRAGRPTGVDNPQYEAQPRSAGGTTSPGRRPAALTPVERKRGYINEAAVHEASRSGQKQSRGLVGAAYKIVVPRAGREHVHGGGENQASSAAMYMRGRPGSVYTGFQDLPGDADA